MIRIDANCTGVHLIEKQKLYAKIWKVRTYHSGAYHYFAVHLQSEPDKEFLRAPTKREVVEKLLKYYLGSVRPSQQVAREQL